MGVKKRTAITMKGTDSLSNAVEEIQEPALAWAWAPGGGGVQALFRGHGYGHREA